MSLRPFAIRGHIPPSELSWRRNGHHRLVHIHDDCRSGDLLYLLTGYKDGFVIGVERVSTGSIIGPLM